MAEEKTARELIADLAGADQETAQAILTAEKAKPEGDQRTTVITAAEERLNVLAVPGDPQDSEPTSGTWAKLLDGDGNPVLVDGKTVRATLTP